MLRPETLQPEPVLAYACADGPSFEGWITSSTSSHPLITSTTTGNVYGWISDVVDNWGCTAYYRYDGLVWGRNADRGNFAWGNLINSTSVSCNWAIGSNDYLKANSTNDCPDSDAEYANQIHLGDLSGSDLLEGVFVNAGTPNARGEFAFIHSDCESYYGGDHVRWNQTFGTGTGPRPGGGSNCDPYDLDGTNNSQTFTVGAPPTGTVSINGCAATTTSSTVTLTLGATDDSAISQVRLSNTGNGSDWQTLTYPTTPAYPSWTLAPGTGSRTVYAQYKDVGGFWGPTTPASDSITVNEDTTRGQETYYTAVPFDLGSGWLLEVALHNGEARLARDLVDVVSVGPDLSLSMTYSSLESASAGMFGKGWASNLTQYLTFESGRVVWHRSDGGAQPFTLAGGVWSPSMGHFESFGRSAMNSEDTITLRDRSKLVFSSVTGRGSMHMRRSAAASLIFALSLAGCGQVGPPTRAEPGVEDQPGPGLARLTGDPERATQSLKIEFLGSDGSPFDERTAKLQAGDVIEATAFSLPDILRVRVNGVVCDGQLELREDQTTNAVLSFPGGCLVTVQSIVPR